MQIAACQRYGKLAAMKRDPFLQRLATVLLGIVLALALAEGALQVAALVVRKQARVATGPTPPPPQATAAGPVILCVGDSFTYGSGSSSSAMSYPGQLETWLRANDASGRAWVVHNAGWPGRNSSEVARKLRGFLDEVHPDYVCVLVGLNNRWNLRGTDDAEPEEVAAKNVAATTEDAGTSGWTWRLPRLFAIVMAAVRERTDPDLRQAESTAVAADANAADAAPADVEAANAPIDVANPLHALEQIRDRRERTADVRPLLETLEQLRPRIRELGDPNAAAALVLLLADVNRYKEAEEEGRLAKERYGMSPALANALVKPLSQLGRAEEAIELGRLAVADAPQDADRLRRLAMALRLGHQSEESLTLFTRLYAENQDRGEYEKQLRKLDRGVVASEEKCAAALAGLDLRDADRAAALESLRRVRDEKGAAPPLEEVLTRDVVRMIELVQSTGARPVLVGYPPSLIALNVTLRRVAAENEIPFVDVEPTFVELLRTEKKERYFVPDGHCNDEGYAVVAEGVGRTVLELPKSAAGE